MVLRKQQVQVDYKGENITCEKTFYSCNHCDFELHLDWMKEQLQQNIVAAYREKILTASNNEQT
jgi:hypothetical protein